MKVLFNPTEKDLTITFKGIDYTVLSKKEMKIEDVDTASAVKYWTEQIHKFLVVRDVIDTGKAQREKKEKEAEDKLSVEKEEINSKGVGGGKKEVNIKK